MVEVFPLTTISHISTSALQKERNIWRSGHAGVRNRHGVSLQPFISCQGGNLISIFFPPCVFEGVAKKKGPFPSPPPFLCRESSPGHADNSLQKRQVNSFPTLLFLWPLISLVLFPFLPSFHSCYSGPWMYQQRCLRFFFFFLLGTKLTLLLTPLKRTLDSLLIGQQAFLEC